jgi:hypothetical protein
MTNGESGDEYGILVHSIQKNSKSRIDIHINEYKGTTFVDIREYYLERDSEQWKPGRKGIAIRDELYPELLQGVISAGEMLGMDGLGDDD